MENSRLREAASTAVNVTVGKRSREYLTDREVERFWCIRRLSAQHLIFSVLSAWRTLSRRSVCSRSES